MRSQLIMRWLVLALLALVLSGCSAARYTSTMKPTGDKDLQYGPERLSLTSFTYEKAGVQPAPPLIDRTAKALYPNVFTDDWAGLPVSIDIKRSYKDASGFSKFFSLTCTLGLTLIPGTYHHDFTVHASVLDSLGESLIESNEKFTINVVEWCSFWPWGLLPVPGFSVMPRDSHFGGDFAGQTEGSINKVNTYAAQCIAEIVARSLKAADQAKLEAAFQERRSRIQDITIDGKTYQGFLTMTSVSKPKPGSTFSLFVYDGYPKQGTKSVHEAVVARYDASGQWQPVTNYLRNTGRLTSVRAFMDGGVPVRVAVRTPDMPPLADFVDTPDLSSPDTLASLRWNNNILLEAKNRSLETVLKEEGRDGLLDLTTRIEQAILDLNEKSEQAKDRAQAKVEKGMDDPAPDRELAILLRQRIEILKPILAAIKQEAALRKP